MFQESGFKNGMEDHSMASDAKTPAGESGLETRIRAALPHMSRSLAKIGNHLLENPQFPVTHSIYELAEAVGTSAPTVTRFCQMVGYDGYQALRISAAASAGRSEAEAVWAVELGHEISPDASPEEVIRSVLGTNTAVLQAVAELLDPALMKRVATEMGKARRVDLYGIGRSGISANDLAAKLFRIGFNATYWTEVELGLASGSLLDNQCVALGISSSGYSMDTVDMLSHARSRGVFAVAVTGDRHSPLARVADAVIQTCPSGDALSSGVLAAEFSQTLTLDVLYLLAAQRDYDRAWQALDVTAAAVAKRRGRRRTKPRINNGGNGKTDGA
jgi:DNA-binding MurR/RpiR family transcriptional regulator